MEIREIIEENLKEAVENSDEEAVKYWGNVYVNYFGTLLNAHYKKTCSKCGRLLPDSEFNTHKGKYKSLSAYCKTCLKEYHRKQTLSKEGKLYYAIRDAKKRGLGFNLVYDLPDNWHGNIEYVYHHINDNDVVALPKKIHDKNTGVSTEKHRDLLKPFVNKIYKNKKKRVSS